MPNRSKTLENPVIFAKFKKRVLKEQPDFDIDIIDRHLEYDEALGEISKRHGYAEKHERDYGKEAMDQLYDLGIKHPKMQSAIGRQTKAVDQEDLDLISYIFSSRPEKNWRIDMKKKAKTPKSVRTWAKSPNRYDIPGVDSIGSTYNELWFG